MSDKDLKNPFTPEELEKILLYMANLNEIETIEYQIIEELEGE